MFELPKHITKTIYEEKNVLVNTTEMGRQKSSFNQNSTSFLIILAQVLGF